MWWLRRSMRSTSASARLRARAAATPANPPPTIAMRGRCNGRSDGGPVTDSLTGGHPPLDRNSGNFRGRRNGNDAARPQIRDLLPLVAEIPQNLLAVLTDLRCAVRGNLGDAVHLDRTAHRHLHTVAGAFERHGDVIGHELRVAHDFLRGAYDAEREMSPIEDLPPMRHRPRDEGHIQDRRERRRARSLMGRIGKTWIGEQLRTL